MRKESLFSLFKLFAYENCLLAYIVGSNNESVGSELFPILAKNFIIESEQGKYLLKVLEKEISMPWKKLSRMH